MFCIKMQWLKQKQCSMAIPAVYPLMHTNYKPLQLPLSNATHRTRALFPKTLLPSTSYTKHQNNKENVI